MRSSIHVFRTAAEHVQIGGYLGKGGVSGTKVLKESVLPPGPHPFHLDDAPVPWDSRQSSEHLLSQPGSKGKSCFL